MENDAPENIIPKHTRTKLSTFCGVISPFIINCIANKRNMSKKRTELGHVKFMAAQKWKFCLFSFHKFLFVSVAKICKILNRETEI